MLKIIENKIIGIRRFKGLGEMNPSILRTVLDSEFEHVLIKPNQEDSDILMKMILDKTEKRTLFDENYSFCIILENLVEQKKHKCWCDFVAN